MRNGIPFTKKQLATFPAYTETVEIATTCLGHTKKSWLDLLWQRVKDTDKGRMRFGWDLGRVHFVHLFLWEKSEEGWEYWLQLNSVFDKLEMAYL